MKIEGALGFTVALSENVKQSNWASRTCCASVRIKHRAGISWMPQSAPGVMSRAQRPAQQGQQKKADVPAPRPGAEALVEILNRQRFISCHSCRKRNQHAAERGRPPGPVVNTFTHILEGYKVAIR
jgi:hypothetical protein